MNAITTDTGDSPFRREREEVLDNAIPSVVVVCGLPGSGKTYFASHLALCLRSIYISSDRVRKMMKRSGLYSVDDKMIVYRRMIELTECALQENKPVVLDGTFYLLSMRGLVKEICHRHHCDHVFIEVQAEESVYRKRLSKPRKDSEADITVYEKVKQSFESINTPHLILNSTDNNLDEMLAAAILQLGRSKS